MIGVYPGPTDTEMADVLTLPKVASSVVAEALLDALERGVEDVFPDPMSQQIFEAWKADPKAVERNIATPT